MPELPPDALFRICDNQCLDFETTADLPPLQAIIGQDRAVKALEFGLEIEEKGFNIYAAGPSGTGKTAAITNFLKERASSKNVPPDWCYVYNFRSPNNPRALSLPPGKAREFQRDMRTLVTEAGRDITRLFESNGYSNRRDELTQGFRRDREQLFKQLDERAREDGFILQSSPTGLALVPQREGRPLTEDEMSSLTPDQRTDIGQRRQKLESDLKQVISHVRAIERRLDESIQEMDQDIVRNAMDFLAMEVQEKYAALPQVVSFLEEVEQDMAENVDLLRAKPKEQSQSSGPLEPPPDTQNSLRRYEVNVIVDNSDLREAPVVSEFSPTPYNIMGRVEREAQFGALQTDLTMIRPGSLHRANGGYFVVRIEEVLRNPLAWEGLKRCLKDGSITIEETADRMGFMTTKGLAPEPIPLDIKTVLIGNPVLYHTLYTHDPDFVELFKVKVDFDSTMDRTEENVRDYAAFICALGEKEDLLPVDRRGVSKLVEHSSRLADDQTKLSTRFSEISDIIREANYWAKKDGSPCITAQHITRAVDEKVHRSDLIRDKIVEMIRRGTIAIDTEGEAVGQVNGLAVLSLGDFSFGRPGRITVTVSPGREGLIDIEREARLGGRLHTKGVMILGGYLADKHAQGIPLSLVARLTMEQSYEEIEGDSASSAELYALLSRLANAPVKQGIAVTGSVNQKGHVQAIGGVNQKVEGFFDVCRAKGLSGSQGVMIPAANVQNLMLREDVVQAVREGRFHIYSVSTIDEGIEILSGERAGAQLPDGSFEEGSVNQRVYRQLRDMASGLRDFMRGDDRDGYAHSIGGQAVDIERGAPVDAESRELRRGT